MWIVGLPTYIPTYWDYSFVVQSMTTKKKTILLGLSIGSSINEWKKKRNKNKKKRGLLNRGIYRALITQDATNPILLGGAPTQSIGAYIMKAKAPAEHAFRNRSSS